MRRRHRNRSNVHARAAWLVGTGWAACFAAAACSSIAGDPLGSGDRTIVDVDATAPPPPTPMDLGPDSAFARIEGSTAYGSAYDANALRTVCSSVPMSPDAAADGAPGAAPAADAGKARIDGGGSPALPDGGSAYGGDGGTSCEPLPPACYGNVSCACVITALGTELPCAYPHCTDDKGFHLYCP